MFSTKQCFLLSITAQMVRLEFFLQIDGFQLLVSWSLMESFFRAGVHSLINYLATNITNTFFLSIQHWLQTAQKCQAISNSFEKRHCMQLACNEN